MVRFGGLAIAVSLGLVAAATPSEATPISLHTVIAEGPGLFSPQTGTVGPVESVHTDGGLAADAIANFGTLNGAASASVSGNISAKSWWQDSFTITGTTPGELLSFRVGTSTHGSLVVPIGTGDVSTNNDNYAGIGVWLLGLPGAVDCVEPGLVPTDGGGIPQCNDSGFQMIRQTYNGSTFLGTENTLLGDFSSTFLVELMAGQTYTITQEMDAFAEMAGVSGVTTESDFIGTVKFSLTPVSPDAGYVTGSGTDYRLPANSVPVPEPASVVLLGVGVLSLGAKRWRKREA